MRKHIRYFFTNCIICSVIILTASVCSAEGFQNAMSLQGYTGLLNVPNAEVTDDGKVVLLYSDQKENKFREGLNREDSYIFSFGILPCFELGGRLTDAAGRNAMRDLSANFKIKMPFIPEDSYLPDLAFGMQDVGGGAKNFQTKYLVASKEWRRLRFSLGYGFGPDRMDGVIGGVELKAFEWLYLLGEDDTEEKNIGFRLVTPEIGGWPVSLQATAKSSLDYRTKDLEFGIGLQFPLGLDRHNRKPVPEKSAAAEVKPSKNSSLVIASNSPPVIASNSLPVITSEAKQSLKPAGVDEIATAQTRRAMTGEGGVSAASGTGATVKVEDSKATLRMLQEKLVAGGFQNVRVGTDPEAAILVVEYENGRYNYNELDGLGVVIGMAVDTASPEFVILQLVVRVKGIRMLQLTAPLSDFHKFLKDPDKEWDLDAALAIAPYTGVDETVSFLPGNANPSWLKSELLLYPAVATTVGTEVGNFDYLLSLKPDYYLNMWKGAVVNARWDVPLDRSEEFEEGHIFGGRRKASQFERLMLFQTLKIVPGLMLNLGGGYILHETYGTINELMWTPGNGNHRFALKHTYLYNSESEPALKKKTNVYLGSYRYYFGPLDLYFIGTAGRFLDQDRGYRLELKRFFGDTALTVYFKDSKTENEEHVQMGGVQIAIPLTLRRDMKPRILQVKGANEWSYAQEVKIVTPGEANLVNTSIGVNPTPLYNLERVFYNRDRLTEDYIRKHLLRLRDAYLTYRK